MSSLIENMSITILIEMLCIRVSTGVQSAVRVGYLLADKDWEEVVRDYTKQINELKRKISEDEQ